MNNKDLEVLDNEALIELLEMLKGLDDNLKGEEVECNE